MAMFQRGGTYLQRLTKLYSDTKQSYESAKVTESAANINDEPEVIELRRDFQVQQDRLLAWGVHWADVEAHYQGQGDVDIDKKIDQAGLGEVVASIMSEIKRLLDESGRLQHPERFELSKTPRGMRSPSNPNLHRKDWTVHEVKTGRTLLQQLTNCIDVLYSLSESRDVANVDEKGSKKGLKSKHESRGSPESHLANDHPLYIDFNNLDFDLHDISQSSDPPPYDASETNHPGRERSVAYYRLENTQVLVDFLTSDFPPHLIGSSDDVFEIHEMGEKLCRNRSLSWCGHLRLLGFTIDRRRDRCGMVYALPEGHSKQDLRQQKTLGSLIAASHNSESSQPALEDRFCLAYNLLLSVLAYIALGDCHQHINSSNVLLVGKPDGEHMSHMRPDIRNPYLLQSCQDFASRVSQKEPFNAMIYRHPAQTLNEHEIIPAYDIYSLGLMLLEIGLWIPLAKLWKPKYDRRIFMERVQRIYSQKLASKCGSRYMRLVQKCLHAPSELHGKQKLEDAGAQLLEIAKELRQCCTIDENGPPPARDIEIFEILVIEQMYRHDNLEDDKGPALPPRQASEGTGIAQKPIIEQEKMDNKTQSHSPTKSEPSLRKWPNLDIPQQDLDQWNSMLMPRLSKILQDTLRDSVESCSVSLMMVGSTIEKARTTICIQCANTTKVRDVLQSRFKPKKGWGVVILRGDVRRSGNRKKPRRALYGPKKQSRRSAKKKTQEQIYQERPSCGASIGAFKDNEHLPPVSYGGTILVDGVPYGMTVHHMLDNPSDDEDDDDDPQSIIEKPTRSAAPRDTKFFSQFDNVSDLHLTNSEDDIRRFSDLEISDEEDEENGEDGDSDSDASTIRPDYSILDADGNEFWFLEDAPPELDDDDDDSDADGVSSSSSDNEDDDASIGDKIGIVPFAEDDLCVTQPALDDVDEDFFPNLEDRDDDHLASHSLGYVHASSGLRRVVHGDIKHEVDWALIRVNEERLKIGNMIHGTQPSDTTSFSKRQRQKQSFTRTNPVPGSSSTLPHLTSITPSTKLSGLNVSCRGRSSGLRTGRISQAMALVKLHGRRSFSSSWCADGGFGIPGDSGAWVYNPVTGELCGHVLAWGDKSRTAFIAPMEVLFEDIRARLGVRSIELPSSSSTIPAEKKFEKEDMGTNVAAEVSNTQNQSQRRSKDIETALGNLSIHGDADESGVGSDGVTAKEPGKKASGVDVKILPIAGAVS